MKIHAKPTSSATTRLTVTHGFRTWCSEPGGLQKDKTEPERSSAVGYQKCCEDLTGAEMCSPQCSVRARVQVNPIAGHLLAQTENQRWEIHWKKQPISGWLRHRSCVNIHINILFQSMIKESVEPLLLHRTQMRRLSQLERMTPSSFPGEVLCRNGPLEGGPGKDPNHTGRIMGPGFPRKSMIKWLGEWEIWALLPSLLTLWLVSR